MTAESQEVYLCASTKPKNIGISMHFFPAQSIPIFQSYLHLHTGQNSAPLSPKDNSTRS